PFLFVLAARTGPECRDDDQRRDKRRCDKAPIEQRERTRAGRHGRESSSTDQELFHGAAKFASKTVNMELSGGRHHPGKRQPWPASIIDLPQPHGVRARTSWKARSLVC